MLARLHADQQKEAPDLPPTFEGRSGAVRLSPGADGWPCRIRVEDVRRPQCWPYMRWVSSWLPGMQTSRSGSHRCQARCSASPFSPSTNSISQAAAIRDRVLPPPRSPTPPGEEVPEPAAGRLVRWVVAVVLVTVADHRPARRGDRGIQRQSAEGHFEKRVITTLGGEVRGDGGVPLLGVAAEHERSRKSGRVTAWSSKALMCAFSGSVQPPGRRPLDEVGEAVAVPLGGFGVGGRGVLGGRARGFRSCGGAVGWGSHASRARRGASARPCLGVEPCGRRPSGRA